MFGTQYFKLDDYTHMHAHYVNNTSLHCLLLIESSGKTSTQQMTVKSSYNMESHEPGECVH